MHVARPSASIFRFVWKVADLFYIPSGVQLPSSPPSSTSVTNWRSRASAQLLENIQDVCEGSVSCRGSVFAPLLRGGGRRPLRLLSSSFLVHVCSAETATALPTPDQGLPRKPQTGSRRHLVGPVRGDDPLCCTRGVRRRTVDRIKLPADRNNCRLRRRAFRPGERSGARSGSNPKESPHGYRRRSLCR